MMKKVFGIKNMIKKKEGFKVFGFQQRKRDEQLCSLCCNFAFSCNNFCVSCANSSCSCRFFNRQRRTASLFRSFRLASFSSSVRFAGVVVRARFVDGLACVEALLRRARRDVVAVVAKVVGLGGV